MLQVVQAYDRAHITEVPTDDGASLETKLEAAHRVFRDRGAWFKPHERIAILRRLAALVEGKRDHLALQIAREGGKPLRDAMVEVNRAVDGIGNAANSHRRVGNLFDVKLRAIENLYAAGVDIVPVITIVNGLNNEQVGRVIEFALDNPKKINFLSFQPVSFTGRDEEVTPERRAAQRYTLSHLAHDVKNQTGLGEPIRDWFPISFMATFTDWADQVHGPQGGDNWPPWLRKRLGASSRS